jgi:hypothetical protein
MMTNDEKQAAYDEAFRAARDIFGVVDDFQLPHSVIDAIHNHPPTKRRGLTEAFRAFAEAGAFRSAPLQKPPSRRRKV